MPVPLICWFCKATVAAVDYRCGECGVIVRDEDLRAKYGGSRDSIDGVEGEGVYPLSHAALNVIYRSPGGRG